MGERSYHSLLEFHEATVCPTCTCIALPTSMIFLYLFPILAGINPQIIRQITDITTLVACSAGALIIKIATVSRHLFLVLQ